MYSFFTRLTFALLFVFFSFVVFGQSSEKTVVSGILTEKSSGEPLLYATVAFYAEPDSNMVANALTEPTGEFSLQLPPGRYYAVFQYIGFTTKTVADIVIKTAQPVLDLGMVTMSSDAMLLDEVEVTAERSQMVFKLDRRVFNVGKDLTNGGNSAADILDKVPSVTVDQEGNVSLRGSQGVRILINGKPSGLLSAGETDALLRMQGDIIESVEVITNPSARYEAEGEAGIINIILKKNQEKGFNGSFGATLGYPQNYGASYNLNYRQKDFNFFSNFGIDYRKSPGGGNSSQRFFDDGVLDEFFTTTTDQLRGGVGGYLQLGTDWNINTKNTLTASFLYRKGDDDNESSVTYRDFDSNQNPIGTVIRDIQEGEESNNLETSLNYKRTFAQKDREWTVAFKYILDEDTELADYEEFDDELPASLLQRSSNTEDEINMLLQTDYVHPIGEKGKLEGGLRAALRTVNNDFLVEEQNNGEFAALSEFNDELKYTEDIYAAYIIGAQEFGRFGLQAGLRLEISDITAALLRSDVANDQDYTNLFPSASLSYKLTETRQLQLSYSRRLSRPYFRRLLPFSNFNNPRNNNIGNPNLRPEFTDSYELGFLQYLDKGTIMTGIYYRSTTGVIERLTLPSEDGTTILFPVNLATRNSYGLELNASYDLKDWWSVNADVNFFRALVEGAFEGVDYSADTYAWSGRMNTQLDFGDLIDMQISYNYRGPQRTTQGRRLSSSALDIGASVDVFKGKGTLSLTGRDLFNDRQRRTVVDLPNYQSESVFQWRQTRQVVLTFNYRLNQDKPRRNGNRERGDDFDE